MISYIYIAYTRDESDFVRDLTSKLSVAGYYHWHDGLALGEQSHWQRAIAEKFDNNSTALFVIILAPGADKADSILYAETLAQAHGIKTIPVLVKPTDLSRHHKNYFDLTNIKADGVDMLVNHIKTLLRPTPGTGPLKPENGVLSAEHKPYTQVGKVLPQTGPLKTMNGSKSEESSLDPLVRAFLQESLEKLRSGDRREKMEAAEHLSEFGNIERVVSSLLEMLENRHPHVLKAVVRTLGDIKNPRAIPELTGLLFDYDTHSDLREAVVSALGKIGDAEAVPALIQVVQEDPEVLVRITAVRALGLLGESAAAAIPTLMQTVRSSLPSRLRRAAMRAIGEMGDLEAVLDLLEFLNDDEEDVRHDAALIIAREWGISGLKVALGEQEWRLREAVVWGLGETRAPDAIPQLIRALSDVEPLVRRSAAWALGRIESEQAYPDLLAQLEIERNSKVILHLIWALGAIGHPAALPTLRDKWLFDQHDAKKREAAATALGSIAHVDAISGLDLAARNDPVDAVQIAAIDALVHLPDPQVVRILELVLFNDDSVKVQQAAATGLQEIGTPAASEVLNRWHNRHTRDDL